MTAVHQQNGKRASSIGAVSRAAKASGWSGAGPLGSCWSRLCQFDAGRFVAAELMVLVAAAAGFVRVQSDTYWHLAAGRAMAQNGRVMFTDEFSHTNYGAPWANYEWLSQVVFFRAHSVGGMPLLTAMCALLIFGSCVLAWRLGRGSIEDRVLLFALAFPLLTPGWSVRPQAFTMFFLVAVIHLVVRERFWALPFIFFLWANLHAAVALGLVVLVADFIAAAAARRDCTRRAAFGALSFGATLLTPLGFSLWPEVWRSLNRSQVNRVSEWLPPALTLEYAVFWLMAVCLVLLAATRWRQLERQDDRTLVVVSILMLLLGVRAARNVVPFGLVVAPAISRLLWQRDVSRRPAPGPGSRLGPALRASVFVVSVLVAVSVVCQRWNASPPPVDWDPVSSEAASAIRTCPGPIYNHYNVGGFLIWFVPEQRVFLDSRQDPYPAQLIRAQREAAGPVALRTLLERYHVQCAVLVPDSPDVPALRSLGWTDTYSDRQWMVMTHSREGVQQ